MTPLTRRERTSTERVTVDLMHIASGRLDLSSNPVDHDSWCSRTVDAESTCTCTNSPYYRDEGR